ncbi:hypothetical protein HZA96_00020 [Candidatus Woesearchaeota archaeon]|nr:hypothetical protein [Candidatus Woesearchaeota archaeon]
MNEILVKLQKFGLSEKEAKVYIACLELNDSTASEIALKSNLPRTLMYDILERLINLGIVSYTIKTNKKYFHAADPKELLRILYEKESAIKSILEPLRIIQKNKTNKRPEVNIYEGKEGMKTVMNDILLSGSKEFLAYGSSRSSFAIIPTFILDWHKRRVKKKIYQRVIYNNSKVSRDRIKEFKDTLRQYADYRLMQIKLDSNIAFMIYKNKAVLTAWTSEPFAVMIENEEMANSQKKYFEELWKIAKK